MPAGLVKKQKRKEGYRDPKHSRSIASAQWKTPSQPLVTTYGETYYDLPGGGQHPFETLEQALYRELLEETGYSICVGRFAAMLEEIARNPKMRENYPAYAHRILHIFHADLAADTPVQPSETDFQQQESLWVPLAEADRLVFRPQLLCGQISRLCQENAVFLGSCFSDYPE